MNDEEKLNQLTTKLEHNREHLSEEILSTKYKKSYQKLKKEIVAEAGKIFTVRVGGCLVIRSDQEGKKLIEEIEKKYHQTWKKLKSELLTTCNVDKFLAGVEQLNVELYDMWIPYFRAHCGIHISDDRTVVYNDLIGKYWVGNAWESHPEWDKEDRWLLSSGVCRMLFCEGTEK